MSLFRNESRKEHSRASTADIAGMGERSARPMAEARADAATRAEAPRDARRIDPQPTDLRREAESRAAFSDTEVEDAVEVKRERRDEPAQPTSKPARSAAATPAMDSSEKLAALFNADAAQDFRSRWDATQIGFVDDPRRAVQQADELVAEVMKTLAQSFADERRQLEAQMHSESASTENLRVALQRYRSFFQRLLSL
jgi:hypothetical protein